MPMLNRLKSLCWLVCFLLIACSSSTVGVFKSEQSVKLRSISIHNITPFSVTNFEISVEESSALLSCSMILPGGICRLGFPEVALQNHKTTIVWSQRGREYRELLTLQNLPLPGMTQIRISINDAGSLDAKAI